MIALVLLAVLCVAVANGANDNFKGVATLHGSGTSSYRRALQWATLTTLCGSLCALLLSGGLIRRFTGKGLVADAVAADPRFLLAVAVGAAGTVLLATRLGFPISTTHALTGGLLGAAVVVAGPTQVSYATLGGAFFLPLLLSPLLSLALAALLYAALRATRRALGVVSEQACICIGGVEQLAAFVPDRAAVVRPSGLTVSVDSLERCERRYVGSLLGVDVEALVNRLHVLSAGATSFARGLNDTPKIVALLVASRALGVPSGMTLVAVAMASGGLLARRVARTMSFGITGMNHGQGFAANAVTAALVSLASPLGLPVSTTHVSCGALFGIGAVNGEARWATVAQIVSAWVTTLPCAALLAALTAWAAGA